MPETSSASSSASSCVSTISFDEVTAVAPPAWTVDDDSIKFLCSYGGRIVPRRHDGKLRYVGGHTRVLTVHRSLRFHGLHQKLRELCGWDALIVRCQLPTEDMDALVSVTSDDDLASLLDEYDAAAVRRRQQLRMIRVFLHPPPPAAGARTPRASVTTPLASPRRPPGHLLLRHATRGAASPSSRAGSFIVVTPAALAPGSPTRPEFFCQCQ